MRTEDYVLRAAGHVYLGKGLSPPYEDVPHKGVIVLVIALQLVNISEDGFIIIPVSDAPLVLILQA